MARRQIPLADNPKKALEDFLIELHDFYYVWYQNSVRRIYWLWLPVNVIGTFAGFATSIVAAFATEESLKHFAFVRIFLVVLPALGSAVATVAVQVRLHGRFELRERGRLAVQSLWNDGRRSFAAAETPEDYTKIHEDLSAKLDQIEADQAIGFFSLAAIPEQKSAGRAVHS